MVRENCLRFLMERSVIVKLLTGTKTNDFISFVLQGYPWGLCSGWCLCPFKLTLALVYVYFRLNRLCFAPTFPPVSPDLRSLSSERSSQWISCHLTSRFSPFPVWPVLLGVRINFQLIFQTLHDTFHFLPGMNIISAPHHL